MLDKRFGESGYTRRSGYHIFTTLDLDMQAMAQKIVNEKIRQFRPRYNLSNAALVAMQPYSGEVLTMVGSADFYDESNRWSGQRGVTATTTGQYAQAYPLRPGHERQSAYAGNGDVGHPRRL